MAPSSSSPSAPSSLSLSHFSRLTLAQEELVLADETSLRFGEAPPDPSTKVVQVETFPSQNGAAHHTLAFSLVAEHQVSVWRRGQTVLLLVRTPQPWHSATHTLRLVLDLGPGSSVPQGTRVVLPLEPDSRVDMARLHQWQVQVQQAQGPVMVLELLLASTAPVGAYSLGIETATRSRPRAVSRFKLKDPVYILFNPYCPGDQVYLPEEELLAEYLLSDAGKIYVGSHRSIRSRPWVFGQFEDRVLLAAVYVLERSRLPLSDRGDPVQVCRAISSVVNSNDNRGVLEGRWNGDYAAGTAPTDWQGSPSILLQYAASHGAPVRYGQCWVFSGVVTTVCRALGLPCRSVTNFSSAHDTNRSLSVDRYYSSSGARLNEVHEPGSGDSVWNFHVWNDVFMARPDLPRGYGGWQAIDATPQERSGRRYQCGPASLAAVRAGMVGLQHDTAFLFAEVNSDIVHFSEDPASQWGYSRSNSNTYGVGRRVVTKAPGQQDTAGEADLQDITLDYKMSEQDSSERSALLNAVRQTSGAQAVYKYQPLGELKAELQVPDTLGVGENFRVRLDLANMSVSARSLETMVTCTSLYYTGVPAHRLKVARGRLRLGPGERDAVLLTVKAAEYLARLVEHCLIKVTCLVRVLETGETWTGEEDFTLEMPRLHLQLEGEAVRRKEARVRVSFRNPLERTLTDCSWLLEAAGVAREARVQHQDLGPGEEVEAVLSFHPRRPGSSLLVVRFSSGDLLEATGSLAIRVRP